VSYAVKVYKARYRGDPGLFGDIGKFIGGAVKGGIGGLLTGNPLAGLAGAVGGGVRAVSGAGKPINPSILTAGNLVAGGRPPAPQIAIDSARVSGVQVGGPNGVLIGSRTIFPSMPQPPQLFPGGPMAPMAPPSQQGISCPPRPKCTGYHLNKTSYFRKGGPCSPYPEGGYVEKGSTWVRNRRRNPLNPRAASRAMARLTSAKRATRSILKFFGASSARRSGGSKGRCGCKGRR
jgi:hypothetical protein